MQWYWWVLIVVGVVAIGYLKLKFFNRFMSKKSQTKIEHEDED